MYVVSFVTHIVQRAYQGFFDVGISCMALSGFGICDA